MFKHFLAIKRFRNMLAQYSYDTIMKTRKLIQTVTSVPLYHEVNNEICLFQIIPGKRPHSGEASSFRAVIGALRQRVALGKVE